MQEYGLDCMHLKPHVYHDLLRCGDGSAEGLITAFFDVVACCGPSSASCIPCGPILRLVIALLATCGLATYHDQCLVTHWQPSKAW